MKKIILALSGFALLFTGCKETDTPLDFNHTPSKDSIYLTTTIVPQTHNVLVEEFSGQSCPNCPAGHTDLENLSANYPGRVNVIGYYASGNPQEVPPAGSIYDFENFTATQIGTNIYGGIGFLPGAGIDRTVFSGNLYLGASSWDGNITPLFTLTDSATLAVTSSYSTVDSVTTATITTTVTYLYPVTTSQNLTIAIVEDSMVDKQENNATASGLDTFYLFTGVFRGMVTSGYSGDAILADTTKATGMTERKIYTFILPATTPAINPAHCRVIAFINGSTSPFGPIWQSEQCKLSGL